MSRKQEIERLRAEIAKLEREEKLEERRNHPKRKTLLANYPATRYGIWVVRGEDPNCDLGGSHVEPLIGYVEGMYEIVVDWALVQPAFFAWGSGGSIEEIVVKKL